MSYDITIIGMIPNQALSDEYQQILQSAELVYASASYEFYQPYLQALRCPIHYFDTPFQHTITHIIQQTDKKIVILATGNPLFYGIASSLQHYIDKKYICVKPNFDCITLACVRLGWAMQYVKHFSVHGRDTKRFIYHLHPHAYFVVLTGDQQDAHDIVEILHRMGYKKAIIHILGCMESEHEYYMSMPMTEWKPTISLTTPYVIALETHEGGEYYNGQIALKDEDFYHDNMITKHHVRAIIGAMLKPYPHAVLWDIGAGCGTVSVEFCLRGGQAYAIEKKAERVAYIEKNKQKFGCEFLQYYCVDIADNHHIYESLPKPDSIFIGGGLQHIQILEDFIAYLKPKGQIVIACVTHEAQSQVIEFSHHYGGEIMQLSLHHYQALGGFHQWKPKAPITIYTYEKLQ